MDERKAGITTATWPIIAQSFFPSEAALAAAELDVSALDDGRTTTSPASSASGRRRCGGFPSDAARRRARVSATMPRRRPARGRARRREPQHGRATRAVGGQRVRRLDGTVCGQRSLFVRVTQNRRPRARRASRCRLPDVHGLGRASALSAGRQRSLLRRRARSRAPGRLEPRRRTSRTARRRPRSAAVFAAGRAAATWCGQATQADRAPNVVAGNPVHWVYMLPSDGADNARRGRERHADGRGAIDAWWRRQDPTRTPRNDLASFACGAQLDLTTVRSSRSSAELSPLGGRLRPRSSDSVEHGRLHVAVHEVRRVLRRAGCPTSTSAARARATPAASVSRSSTSARAPGCRRQRSLRTSSSTRSARSRDAPNDCTGESSGHACDAEATSCTRSSAASRSAAKILDLGRDDYYGALGQAGRTPGLGLARQPRRPGAARADDHRPGLGLGRRARARLCAQAARRRGTPGSGSRSPLRRAPGAKLVRWGGACSGRPGCTLAVGAGATVSRALRAARRSGCRSPSRDAARSGASSAGSRAGRAARRRFPSLRPGAADGDAREGVEAPLVDAAPAAGRSRRARCR